VVRFREEEGAADGEDFEGVIKGIEVVGRGDLRGFFEGGKDEDEEDFRVDIITGRGYIFNV